MRRSLLLVLLLVLGIAGAFVVANSAGFLRSGGHARERVAEPSAPPEPSLPSAAPSSARVPLAPAPGFEGEADPWMPAAAGDGQALLRVEVVAVEDGHALSGIELRLLCNVKDGEPPTSTQRDPARGLDGDTLVTDARGRGEFVARVGVAFRLSADGPNGEDVQSLAPLVAAETRSVRVVLRGRGETWSVRALHGASEAPIAGASVRVLNAYSRAAVREVVADAKVRDDPDDEPALVAEGRTDGAGRFSAEVPLRGSLFARIEAPGYHFAGCNVEPGAERDVHLLPPASLAVLLRERDGRPAAAVEVRLRTSFDELIENTFRDPQPEWLRVTDAEGRCTFAVLPPAARLAVELRRGERVVGRPGGITGELELDGGEQRAIEWRLDGGCRLVGRAHDPAGKPLVRVSLVLESFDGDPAELGIADRAAGELRATENVLGRAPAASLVTDAQGAFVLDDVGAGTWALGLAEYESLRGFFDERFVFAIAAGETEKRLDLRLDPQAQIAGRVFAPDGTPVRARVIAHGTGPGGEPLEVSDWSAVSGEFQLYGLMPGEYRLEADPKEAALCGPPPVTARTGAEDVVLRLEPGAAADVRVLDASGTPAPANVFAFPAGGTEEAEWGIAQDDGLVHLENLAPGTYDLVAHRPGEVAVLRAAALRGPAREELVLRLAPAASVEVRTSRPADVHVRVDLFWEGRRIEFAFAGKEPLHLSTPPGPVTVRWIRIDAVKRQSLLHEESGIAGGEGELAFEYAVE